MSCRGKRCVYYHTPRENPLDDVELLCATVTFLYDRCLVISQDVDYIWQRRISCASVIYILLQLSISIVFLLEIVQLLFVLDCGVCPNFYLGVYSGFSRKSSTPDADEELAVHSGDTQIEQTRDNEGDVGCAILEGGETYPGANRHSSVCRNSICHKRGQVLIAWTTVVFSASIAPTTSLGGEANRMHLHTYYIGVW